MYETKEGFGREYRDEDANIMRAILTGRDRTERNRLDERWAKQLGRGRGILLERRVEVKEARKGERCVPRIRRGCVRASQNVAIGADGRATPSRTMSVVCGEQDASVSRISRPATRRVSAGVPPCLGGGTLFLSTVHWHEEHASTAGPA